MKDGVHLEHVSVVALSHFSEKILLLANSLFEVETYVDDLRRNFPKLLGPNETEIWDNFKDDSNSIILSYAAALARQVEVLRECIPKSEAMPSLLALDQSLCGIREPVKILNQMCIKNLFDRKHLPASAKTIIDSLEDFLDRQQLRCSTATSSISLAIVNEIFASSLLPFVRSLSRWISYGTVEGAPIEFCFSLGSGDEFDASLCPSVFEDVAKELHFIGVCSSLDGICVPRVTQNVEWHSHLLQLTREYLAMLQQAQDLNPTCNNAHQVEQRPAVDNKLYDRSWNNEWIEEIVSDTVIPLQSNIGDIKAPDMDSLNQLDDDHTRSGLGRCLEFRMSEASKKRQTRYSVCNAISSNWTSGFDHQGSFIDKLRARVLEKIEQPLSDKVEHERYDRLDQLESKVSYQLVASAIQSLAISTVAWYNESTSWRDLRTLVADQLRGLKSMTLLDSPRWNEFTEFTIHACSSSTGLDSSAIFALNDLLQESICMEYEGFKIQDYILTANIESLMNPKSNKESEYYVRRTEYVKQLQWQIRVMPPCSSLLGGDSLDVLGNLRDLTIQILWVWTTIKNAIKQSMKDKSLLDRRSSVTLNEILRMLHHILQTVTDHIVFEFDACIHGIQSSRSHKEIEESVKTLITILKMGEFSHQMILRDPLMKWLDASLELGVVVLGTAHRKRSTDITKELNPLSSDSFQRSIYASLRVVHETRRCLLTALSDGAKLYGSPGVTYRHLENLIGHFSQHC